MLFFVKIGCEFHICHKLSWERIISLKSISLWLCCLFPYCRFTRSWSGRLQMRAGLFLEGSQTSPGSMIRYDPSLFISTYRVFDCVTNVWACPDSKTVYSSVLWSSIHICFWLSALCFWHCFLLFLGGLWKWLGPDKEAYCFQTTNRIEPSQGMGLSWFWDSFAVDYRRDKY